MYLYNGHRAPGLPVYDPGELPYGLIVSSNADNTALILMLCVNRPYYGTNPSDSTKTGVYNTGRMKVYTCTDTDEAWTFSLEADNPLTANDDDPGGGVLWTLDDILKTDGSVWMAGTQPVPERVTEAWVRSFKEGLALGLTGAPLPYTGTEPVAYLYNGVRLPPLPEWVKQYNNALIAYTWARYIVYGFNEYTPDETLMSSGEYYATVELGEYSYSWHEEANGKWEDEIRHSTSGGSYQKDIVWASTDIRTLSGDLTLSASDPVPVYE